MVIKKKNNIRDGTTNILRNYYKEPNKKYKINQQVTTYYNVTKNYLKEHSDIIAAESDQGNSTVITYEKDYKKLLATDVKRQEYT